MRNEDDTPENFNDITPLQLHELLYAPLSPQCMLQFRDNIEPLVNQAPFFKLSEILLNEIHKAGSIKLTTIGNMPMQLCELLCAQDLIYWPYKNAGKRIREEDFPYLWPLKHYLINSGIAKKRHNVLTLTKTGERLLNGPASVRFIQLFNYMVNRFNWINWNHIDDDGRYGNLGWAYSLVLLSKYGDIPRNSRFYSQQLFDTFEIEKEYINEYGLAVSASETFHRAYESRIFKNFGQWFGLVNIEGFRDSDRSYSAPTIVTKSALFDQLFIVYPTLGY